jgi:hypothetical protein
VDFTVAPKHFSHRPHHCRQADQNTFGQQSGKTLTLGKTNPARQTKTPAPGAGVFVVEE